MNRFKAYDGVRPRSYGVAQCLQRCTTVRPVRPFLHTIYIERVCISALLY